MKKKWIWILLILATPYIIAEIRNEIRKEWVHYSSNPQFTKDEKHLYISLNTKRNQTKGDIYKINLDGEVEEKITCDNNDNIYPLLNGDDSKLAYTKIKNGGQDVEKWDVELREVDLKNRDERVQIKSTRLLESEEYSRDGNRILFRQPEYLGKASMGGKRWRHWDIYEWNRITNKVKRLTTKQFYSLFDVTYYKQSEILLIGEQSKPKLYSLKVNSSEKPTEIDYALVVNLSFTPDKKTLIAIKDNIYDKTTTNKDPRDIITLKKDLADSGKEIYATHNMIIDSKISPTGKKVIMIVESKSYRRLKLYLLDIPSNSLKEIKITRI